MTWIINLDDIAARWAYAQLVILIRAALDQLAALPARPRVFVIVEMAGATSAFQEAAASQLEIEHVLS